VKQGEVNSKNDRVVLLMIMKTAVLLVPLTPCENLKV
jgi:hypothetical protein